MASVMPPDGMSPDQLRAALSRETGRRWQLELEVFDARAALALARADLDGTRACERRARHQAQHDGLTSLPNRVFFSERLDHALGLAVVQRRPLAVMFLDLDGFKAINDMHGHFIGDEVLSIVAARLGKAVRADDVVSRFGGDEFACMLANVSRQAQLSSVACKLFDAVSAPIKVGALHLTVRPSIGMAIYPADGATAAALLQSADCAMYQAKRDQTGYAFFSPSDGTRSARTAGN